MLAWVQLPPPPIAISQRPKPSPRPLPAALFYVRLAQQLQHCWPCSRQRLLLLLELLLLRAPASTIATTHTMTVKMSLRRLTMGQKEVAQLFHTYQYIRLALAGRYNHAKPSTRCCQLTHLFQYKLQTSSSYFTGRCTQFIFDSIHSVDLGHE